MKRWKVLIAVLLLSMCATGLFAQEEGWYFGKPIKDIRFEGLETISETELLGLVSEYKGQLFTEEIILDLQSRIYALDSFQSIIPKAEPGDDNYNTVVIVLEVTEYPVIKQIEFRGNKSIKSSELDDQIVLKEEQMYNELRAKYDRKAIETYYLEKGFVDIKVQYYTEKVEDSNALVLTFDITEGQQTIVSEVKFSGNTFASDNALKGQLESETPSLFSKGIYSRANVEQDKENIKTYYKSRGYIDAEVIDVVVETVDEDAQKQSNKVSLTYFLKEGDRYTFGGINFVGNTIFSDEELEKFVTNKKGAYISLVKVETSLQLIKQSYMDEGYIFNQFTDKQDRDEANKIVFWTLEIVENSRAYVEKVIIKGNSKTKYTVIRREIPIEPGDVYSSGKIVQAVNNLYNTRYFEDVQVEPSYGSTDGLVDLVFIVEEGRTADISLGITFSGDTEFPISGQVKWNDKNFLGGGQTLGVELTASPVKQTLGFNFSENWILGYRWSGGINFSINHGVVSDIPQDILEPVFQDENIPDPYDGHYVFTRETEYNNVTYQAGDPFPGVATQEEILEYNLMIDYLYFGNLNNDHNMEYETYDFSLGLNTGYTWHTNWGRIQPSTGFSTKFQYVEYDPTVYRPAEPTLRENLRTWNVINKFWFSLKWDTRDIIFNPSKGGMARQRLTFAGFFGDRQYIRSDTKGDVFFTLWDYPIDDFWKLKGVLMLHSEYSLLAPSLNGTFKAEATDYLYIDGMMSARGWPIQRNGKVLWDNTVEIRMPIVESLLWFDFFLDAAALYPEFSSNEKYAFMDFTQAEDFAGSSMALLDDFRFSFGAGLRLANMQFPIALYLAKPFEFENGAFKWSKTGDRFDLFDGFFGMNIVIAFAIDL